MKPALGATMTFLTDATLWLTPARDLFTSVFGREAIGDDLSSSDDTPEQLRGLVEEDLDNTYIAEVLRSRFYVRLELVACMVSTAPDFAFSFTD